MQLPNELQRRRYSDWNDRVRGLMVVWEAAGMGGFQEQFEAFVLQDRDGAMTELLAQIGNDCRTLPGVVRLRIARAAVSTVLQSALMCSDLRAEYHARIAPAVRLGEPVWMLSDPGGKEKAMSK